MSRLTRSEIETLIDDLIVAHPIYTPQLRALREQSLSQEAVRNEALDLGQFVNAAHIGGADAPHQVVEKLQRAINAAALKREPNAAGEETDSEVMSISSDRVRTPAPTVPVSETPETDAAVVIGDGVIGPRTQTGFQIKFELNKEWVFADLARSLERRLSLAQTEIKGHMRTEDDLKARIKKLEWDHYDAWAPMFSRLMMVCNRLEKGLPIKLEEVQGWGNEHPAPEAQARIAELEKELTWCADHSGECLGDHMQRLNLIRALLKSRA